VPMQNAASFASPKPPGDSVLCLGRYEILAELGSGGTSRVFLARATGEAGFQRLFAIKVMREHVAGNHEFVQMFLDEARLTSGLHHPNIVSIVDLGRDHGRYFLVMDYIEGGSLAQLCRSSPKERDPRKLVPLFLDALEGLHAAHVLTDDADVPLRIVHRDFSTHNIMVGVDGVARVVDFGIAKAEARLTSTSPGMLKGRAGLVSPEQLGTPEDVDGRADIFSAGATLWSVLTGRALFAGGSDAATLRNVLDMAIEPPSTVGLRPPECFDAICLKALARDRSLRYPTAAAMAADLRATALANGMLADRLEIAAWVKSTFRKELAARRDAVRRRSASPRITPLPTGTAPTRPTRSPARSSPAPVARRSVTPFALSETRASHSAGRVAQLLGAGLLAALVGVGGAFTLRALQSAQLTSSPLSALMPQNETDARPPPTAITLTSSALVPLQPAPGAARSSSSSSRDAGAPNRPPTTSRTTQPHPPPAPAAPLAAPPRPPPERSSR
jgi:eukaryotic-like serine/threonine-protein kinase